MPQTEMPVKKKYIRFVPGQDGQVWHPGASICSLSSEINDVAHRGHLTLNAG